MVVGFGTVISIDVLGDDGKRERKLTAEKQ